MPIPMFIFILFRCISTTVIFSGKSIEDMISNYTIQSTFIPRIHSKRDTLHSDKCHHLKLNILEKEHHLCVKIFNLSYPGLINEKTKFFLSDSNVSKSIDDLDLKTIGGYILDYEYNSSVSGYLHESYFFGKVQLNSDTFYVEPVTNFNLDKAKGKNNEAFIYKKPESSLYDEVNGTFTFRFDIFDIDMEPNFGRFEKIYGKLCYVTVVLDNSFTQAIGNGNPQHAIQKLLLNFNEVNSILRSTDFDKDGYPDNIGIAINVVITLASRNANTGTFSEIPIDEPVDPLDMLQKFAAVSITRSSCLNILLIGHPFIKQFLGVSFTATKNVFDRFKHVGICGGNSVFVPSLNALVITYRFGNGETLPKPLVDVNLVHEIAHSFGSNHDSGDCLKGHIMSPKTSIPTNVSNFEFSECSKRDISTVLRKQGNCLESTAAPYCGNGIIEKGEECDCGSSYHCLGRDPCCHPRDSDRQCKINKRTYQCHPAEGLCCSNQCTFKNMHHTGLNCSKFQRQCPCSSGKNCLCGLTGTCVNNECHSFECTRLGLKECPCPILSDTICRTCCTYRDGTCIPSIIAAKDMITSNVNFALRTDAVTLNIAKQDVRTFCNLNNCFHLNFHHFSQGNFCTFHGHLGVCMESRCNIPNYVAARVPQFRKYERSSATFFELNVLCIFSFIKIIRLFAY